jgi:DNA-binding winged helix-turn-helix (wHTH) protein
VTITRDYKPVGRPATLRRSGAKTGVERRAVRLSEDERHVLAVLVRHTGEAVRHQAIYDAVWGEGVFDDADCACRIETRRLRLLISRLRRKLAAGPGQQGLIQTVQGAGYRIEEAADVPAQDGTHPV